MENTQDGTIEIIDGSGDREYFTIIPNYIINNSTAISLAIYIQLKRLAGEKGMAYPGSRYLTGKLGIHHSTLKKGLQYLIDKGWIEYVGDKKIQTLGGLQTTKSYKIVDIWRLNNTTRRGVKIDRPTKRATPEGVLSEPLGGVKIATYKEPLNKNHKDTERSSDSPFVLKEYLTKMQTDPKRHVRLISYFILRKELEPSSVAEVGEIIRRWSRTAIKVSETYTKVKISKAIDICIEKHSDIDWGLDTVYKKLTNINL